MEKRDADWVKAKRLCGLSAEDVRMAKELGVGPRSLITNIPSPREPWKAPVREWVRELYRRRREKAEKGREVGVPARRNESRGARLEPEPRHAPHERLAARAAEENAGLSRRQRELRVAADHVAAAFARIEAVQRVVLFGSVAAPLSKEVPRFQPFRRAGVAVWHECRDVDLAVWLTDCGSLHGLAKARSRALNEILDEDGIGVAHHQVDVFILEPGTDRYRGRLCTFGTCPKGKGECLVPGCGEAPFLQRHARFAFDVAALAPEKAVPLFDRESHLGPPVLRRVKDDSPTVLGP